MKTTSESKWSKEYLNILNSNFKNTEPSEILKWAVDNFGDKAAMGTGFGSSGLLLLHQIYRNNLEDPKQSNWNQKKCLFNQNRKPEGAVKKNKIS